MNTAGYSGKPLIEKLGYKPNEKVLLINAPGWFVEYLKSVGVLADTVFDQNYDWLHAFFDNKEQLIKFCEKTNFSNIGKGFWVSWPKKTSQIQTDLTEQIFRDYILQFGWVDTKVAAIDDQWSGLKFLRRTST